MGAPTSTKTCTHRQSPAVAGQRCHESGRVQGERGLRSLHGAGMQRAVRRVFDGQLAENTALLVGEARKPCLLRRTPSSVHPKGSSSRGGDHWPCDHWHAACVRLERQLRPAAAACGTRCAAALQGRPRPSWHTAATPQALVAGSSSGAACRRRRRSRRRWAVTSRRNAGRAVCHLPLLRHLHGRVVCAARMRPVSPAPGGWLRQQLHCAVCAVLKLVFPTRICSPHLPAASSTRTAWSSRWSTTEDARSAG